MTDALPRLSRATLARLDGAAVELPTYDAAALPERAVQFGTGAFLRGFVEHFLDEANRQGHFGGRVVLVGSTGSGRDETLATQDGLFTLATQGIDGGEVVQRHRVVASVSRALSAVRDWDAVLALARSPELEIVFSNTTEVGIVHDPADSADPDAARGAGSPPRSYPGKLARFLLERARAFGFSPDKGLVVLPCELIERNGEKLRDIVRLHAEAWGTEPEFRAWLDEAVVFCDTLVDRIVPGAPDATTRERLLSQLGYDDALLTACEVYRLFAIAWERKGESVPAPLAALAAADAGVLLVGDVAPFRERKVRLLNGAHTLMAPLALLLGCHTVREAVTHEAAGALVRHAMREEIAPFVEAEGATTFAEEVLDRFANPHIRHALLDITLQGTMKLRVRVIPAILRYVARTGRVPQSLAFGFAAFLEYMRGDQRRARLDAGLPVPADDGAARLEAAWAAHGVDAESVGRLVHEVCADAALWGADLAAVPGFREAVTDHLWRVRTEGVRSALDHLLAARAA